MKRPLAIGDRTYLRRPAPGDEAEFIAMVRASRRLHRPWVTPPDTPERFAAYLRRGRRRNRENYLVCRREDDAIVGMINVSEIVRGGFQSAFVGYGGSRHTAGAGFMTEGLRLVVRDAFERLALHRLEANIQPGNRASIALARRAGFVYEGTARRYIKIGGRWRDHEHWVVLREEWRAR